MSLAADRSGLPLRALGGIFGGLFCGYVGLTAAIPVLPGFVKDRFGAANVAVGLVVTGTAVTALLTRPIVGGLADRHGHRLLMQFGAVIVAAGGALYFVHLSLAGLVVVRLLIGVGEAALFTAGAVWAVALSPHDRRGQLIGLYGVSMWGGISVGTLLGGVLQRVSFGAVWACCMAIPLAGFALITAVPAPPRMPRAAGRGLRLRPALLPGTGLALAAAGYAGLASFIVLFMRSRGIHQGVLVLTVYSAVYAGTRLVIGHLPDRLGPRRVAAWSGAGEAAGLLIIATAPDLAVALAGSVVMGAGFSLLHPSLALMVMNRAGPGQQGAALGAYTSFWDLGLTVWGPVTGVIASGFGYQAVFFLGAGCAAAAAALAFVIGRPVASDLAISTGPRMV
ncbi:MAG TPA: MFS transporter [Streptosporangiaceae bacterium]|nr:MFS transporter [Streptosporangiaceae bacterium]